MARTGRPKKEVDFSKIDSLASMHCTAQEIVEFMNATGDKLSYDTVDRRIRSEHGMTFAEYINKKHMALAKPKLRKLQWAAAESGNVTMLIWLGKQYLGQSDKTENNHSGTVGVIINDNIPKGDGDADNG